jgi:hypothetical protein
MSDYDDGIDDGGGASAPQMYLLGDQGDYEGGPKITYKYLGDNWFKVDISGNITVKVRIESDPNDDENYIITGLVNKTYNINVK